MIKEKKKSFKNIVLIFLIIIIILALLNIFIVFIKFSEFKKLTGHALGYTNITINTAMAINLSRDSIDWGPGSMDEGVLNSSIWTNGDNNGIVQRGNWSGIGVKGIVVQNIGTMNCSIWIKTNKNAHDLFNSSSSSNEQFMLNLSNKENNSCSGGAQLDQWMDVNQTGQGTEYCSQFGFLRDNDEIYLDVLLTIPFDVNNLGRLSEFITVTGDVVE